MLECLGQLLVAPEGNGVHGLLLSALPVCYILCPGLPSLSLPQKRGTDASQGCYHLIQAVQHGADGSSRRRHIHSPFLDRLAVENSKLEPGAQIKGQDRKECC